MVTLPPRPGSSVTSQKVSPLWLCTPLRPPHSLPPAWPVLPCYRALWNSCLLSKASILSLFSQHAFYPLSWMEAKDSASLILRRTSTSRRAVPLSHFQTISLPLPKYSQPPLEHRPSGCTTLALLQSWTTSAQSLRSPSTPSPQKTVARRPVSLSLPFLPSSVVWLRPRWRLPTPAWAFLALYHLTPRHHLPCSPATQFPFILRFAIFCISSTSGIFPWVSHWAPSPMLLGSSLRSSNRLAHEDQEPFHLLAFCLPLPLIFSPSVTLLQFDRSSQRFALDMTFNSRPSFLPSSFQPHLNQTCLPALALVHAWRKTPSSLAGLTGNPRPWTSSGLPVVILCFVGNSLVRSPIGCSRPFCSLLTSIVWSQLGNWFLTP